MRDIISWGVARRDETGQVKGTGVVSCGNQPYEIEVFMKLQ